MDVDNLIDRSALKDLHDLAGEDLVHLLERFEESVSSVSWGELTQAELKSILHKLAGTAGTLALTHLAGTMRDYEKTVADGKGEEVDFGKLQDLLTSSLLVARKELGKVT